MSVKDVINIVTWLSDYRRGLDWQSDLLDTLTHNSQITVTHRLVFSVTVFTAMLGNGFQHWTFFCPRAHVLAGWRLSHTNLLLF
jgi:hypothetical protein